MESQYFQQAKALKCLSQYGNMYFLSKVHVLAVLPSQMYDYMCLAECQLDHICVHVPTDGALHFKAVHHFGRQGCKNS